MSNLAIAQNDFWSDLKHVKGENAQYTQSTCKKYMYIKKKKTISGSVWTRSAKAPVSDNAINSPGLFSPRLWSGKQSNFCTFLKPSLLVWWLYIKAICVNRAVLQEALFFLRWTKTALAFMFFYSWGGWSWTPVFQSFLSPAQSCSEQSPRPRSLLRTAYNRPSFSLSSFKHQ